MLPRGGRARIGRCTIQPGCLLGTTAEARTRTRKRPSSGIAKPPNKAMPKHNTTWRVCLDNGRGTDKDEKQAVEWYRKAAEQGMPQHNTTWVCAWKTAEARTRTRNRPSNGIAKPPNKDMPQHNSTWLCA